MATTYADPSAFMKTSVIFILDESGSMLTKQSDVIGGFNQYVKELRDKNEPVILSAIKFNSSSQPLFSGKTLDEVPELTDQNYRPSGNTALLDAIGDALKEYPAEAKVLVIIMTDGEENSSHRYTKAEIKANIEYCIEKGQWAFVYLGAGVDAFAEAGSMGIPIGSTIPFVGTGVNTYASLTATAGTTSTYAAAPTVTTPVYRANLGDTTLGVGPGGAVTMKWQSKKAEPTDTVQSDPAED